MPHQHPPQEIGPWMTAEQAAAYLQLSSARALYQLVRRGRVRAHQASSLRSVRRPSAQERRPPWASRSTRRVMASSGR